MPLETGTKISDLNANWPLGSDPKSQGDDHIRLIKTVLQNDAATVGDLDDYLPLTGGTMTGDITIENTTPALKLIDTEEPPDAKRWDIHLSAGNMSFTARDDEGVFTETYYLDIDGGVPSGSALVSRESGDARYIRQVDQIEYQAGFVSDGTSSGRVTFPTAFSDGNVSVTCTALAPGEFRVVSLDSVISSRFDYEIRGSGGNLNTSAFHWIAVARTY